MPTDPTPFPGGTPDTGTTNAPAPAPEGGFLSVAEAVEEQLRDLQTQAPPAEAPSPDEPETPSEPDQRQSAPDPFEEPEGILSSEQLAPPHSQPDPAEPEAAPAPTQDPTSEVIFEHEGRPITAEEARRGFLREADYHAKTRDLADKRRAFEAEQQALQQERQLYSQALTTLKTSMEDPRTAGLLSAEEMAQLQHEDPTAWLQQRELQREHQDKLQRIEAEQQRVFQEEQAVQQKQFQDYVQDQQAKLVALMPDWSDEKVSTQRKTDMVNYLKDYGFSEQEMANIYDHRLIRILTDALRGKAVANPASLDAKKVVTPAPTVRTSRRQGQAEPRADTRIRQAEKRLSQSNSFEDAVALQLARQEQRTH
jgi:hypothetical protein